MTQPSLNTTFDTSLVDLSQEQTQSTNTIVDPLSSFSTTESAPSDDYRQPQITNTPTQSKEKMPTRYIPTVDAYNTWAEVYDTDGNMLQSIDDFSLHVEDLFEKFVALATQTKSSTEKLKIVDLGCGTGRNTLPLLRAAWPEGVQVRITAIDASSGMLELCKSKVEKCIVGMDEPAKKVMEVDFLLHDFLDPSNPLGAPIPLPEEKKFDGLLSTLVLEHFPLAPFFATLSFLLKIGGIALVTNMHPEMGSQSQAGFVSQDEEGQAIKVRGTSWVHGVQETIDAARQYGFEIVGEVREKEVTEEMIRGAVVGERGRKWIGVKVWYGFILRKFE